MSRPAALALADEAVAIRDGHVDAAVEQRALVLLTDFLGVSLGGAGEPSSVAIRRGLAALGTRGDATVLGVRARAAPPHAALANGAAAHALEMDDTFQPGSIHLGAAVFPAALATAELTGASGRALLRAAIAGYEVGGRLAMALDPAVHYARGFHPTGTCGAFAAATTSALLMGLDAAGTAGALGIAGSQAAGSMEFLADGAWTKRVHPGWAAAAGMHAAALAAAGVRAPTTIFDGRFGTLHAYAEGGCLARLTERGEWVVLRTSIKPHACCRYAQGPIDATLALRARHQLRPSDVSRIDVGLVAAGFPIICEPREAKRRPTCVVDAQFSLPFSVAIALVDGDAAPERFRAERWTDPTVQAVMDRVQAERDAALDARYPDVWPVWVRMQLADGRQIEERVTHPKGDPEHFLSDAELGAKFDRLAGAALGVEVRTQVLRALAALPGAPDLHALLAAVT